MADNDVLINFVGHTEALQPAETALDNIIAKEGAIGEAWKKTSEAINTESKKSAETTNKLAKSIEAMATAAKSMDKVVIGGAYKQYLKEIQAQLGLTNKELITYVQNTRKAAQAAIFSAKTEQEINELTLSIEAMNEQLEQLGIAEHGVAEKTTTLRQRLKEAKDELVALADAGITTGPAFDAAKKKAGELDDQMRDLNATIKGTGSDTKNIDGLISLASGVAGGFAIAQGAAALFGSENEEVQKALLKVNAAMAILQGLQQFQNLLQKESAAMLLLADIRTKALALGQQFLAATTLESVAATTALRTALIASGIGAFVVILGLVANAMGAFGDETADASEAQESLRNSVDLMNTSLEVQAGILSRMTGEKLARLAAEGASEATLNKVKKKSIEDEIELLKQKEANSRMLAGREKAGSDEQQARYKEANDFFYQQEALKSKIKIEGYEQEQKINEDTAKKREELEKKRLENLEKAREKELSDLKTKVDAQLKALDKEEEQLRIHFENEQEIIDRDKQQKIKDAEDWDTQWKAFQASLVKSAEDSAKLIADAEKQKIEKILSDAEKQIAKLNKVFGLFTQGLADVGASGTFTSMVTELTNFAAATEEILAKIKAGTIKTLDGVKELAAAAVTAAQVVINQVFADASAKRQQIAADEIAALEEQKQKELAVKNLTEQQKADIENRFRQQERRIKIEAFNADKEAKKSQALINAALGATLAIAEYPWPYSLVVAGIVAGLAGIEIAEINRQQPPRFKQGKVDIDGPGTSTSDSIPAWISKGESVINAPATAKWKDALQAMNTGQFDDYLVKKFQHFIFPSLPDDASTSSSTAGIDYVMLAKEVAREMKGIIPAPAQVTNTIDGDGLHSFVQNGNSRTEILNKRYSMS